MLDGTGELPPRNAALIAGLGYLMVFVFGGLANGFLLDNLIVPGEPAAAISNIAASEALYRLGIACWLIVLTFDVVVAWG
jgi:hypothetical protein